MRRAATEEVRRGRGEVRRGCGEVRRGCGRSTGTEEAIEELPLLHLVRVGLGLG